MVGQTEFSSSDVMPRPELLRAAGPKRSEPPGSGPGSLELLYDHWDCLGPLALSGPNLRAWMFQCLACS